jgi:hypothetical protein
MRRWRRLGIVVEQIPGHASEGPAFGWYAASFERSHLRRQPREQAIVVLAYRLDRGALYASPGRAAVHGSGDEDHEQGGEDPERTIARQHPPLVCEQPSEYLHDQ